MTSFFAVNVLLALTVDPDPGLTAEGANPTFSAMTKANVAQMEAMARHPAAPTAHCRRLIPVSPSHNHY